MADPASDIATQAAPAAVTAELNEFESLLQQQFRPKTPHARQAVETAVRTLAEQALAAPAPFRCGSQTVSDGRHR